VKKILYVASTFSHIRHFHLPYLRFFQKSGYEVHVGAGGTPCPIPGADKILSFPFEKSFTSFSNWRLSRQIARLIQENEYYVVSVHTSLAAFFTRLAIKPGGPWGYGGPGGPGGPLVVNTAHGYLFDRNTPFVKRMILRQAEKIAAQRTHLLMIMNRQDHQIAHDNKLSQGGVYLIPGMGVDLSRYPVPTTEQKTALRKQYGIDPGAIVLVFAAEFSQRKNQRMLIRALAKLPPLYTLLLPGDGADWEHCKNLAAQLGVAGRVIFPGQVADTWPYYAASDLCVSAARIEGLPFHIVECMSTGLPVVASAIKGHEDLIGEGGGGMLYPYGDESAFCEAVRRIAEDPETMAQMGRINVEKSRLYALQAAYPTITEIYGNILGIRPLPLEEIMAEAGKTE
jgi:glycosyltransferase involved in cell wall biosynthesis